MMPLFFATSHINYARYEMYYLRTIEQLPEEVREHFIKGEHTMHHNAGINNGIWSDMTTATTLCDMVMANLESSVSHSNRKR